MNTETQVSEAPSGKTKREPTVVEEVSMADGRTVGFPGKTKLKKEWVDLEGSARGVRFDFRNGATRIFDVTSSSLLTDFACHGASQKIGDEAGSEEEVDDMVVAIDAIIGRLAGGEWGKQRSSGASDSYAGASIVIRALIEATGKTVEFVKAYLDKKLANDPMLTRKDLYASFKNPNSETGKIIARLENEKKAKAVKVDADAELAALRG
jgi:hypothetical protein